MTTIRVQNNVSSPVINLVCFHWVGGSVTSYKEIAKHVEEKKMKVYSVVLPGRNGRGVELITRNMGDLVRQVKIELEKVSFDASPIIFFGHSLGGLLAYELVRAMESEGSCIQVAKLIVSAVHSPVNLTRKNKDPDEIFHHKQSDADLFNYIKSIGGLPRGVDPSFLRMILPTIKADYEAFETYDMEQFPDMKVKCPFAVFFAREDASVPVDSAVGWVNVAAGPCQAVEFTRGSHFYLLEQTVEFVARLADICELPCSSKN